MDELSEDEKLVVSPRTPGARFLSQALSRGRAFHHIPGKLVSIEDPIRGFNMIIDGGVDKYPEAAFMLVGTMRCNRKRIKAACRKQIKPNSTGREN